MPWLRFQWPGSGGGPESKSIRVDTDGSIDFPVKTGDQSTRFRELFALHGDNWDAAHYLSEMARTAGAVVVGSDMENIDRLKVTIHENRFGSEDGLFGFAFVFRVLGK